MKKGEENQIEVKEQIEEYASFEEIRDIENLNKYTVIAVNDKIYVKKFRVKRYTLIQKISN